MRRWTILALVLLAAGCSGSDNPQSGEDLSWAFQSGGPGPDLGAGIAAFADHSGVTIGVFRDSITLGPGQPNETVVTSLGHDDVFVIHHARDGRIDWVRHVGGPAPVTPGGLCRFPDGSFVMAGSFGETVTVGVGQPDAMSLTSAGHADVFLVRFRGDGTLQWAKRAGGDGNEAPRGYFQHTITFGPGEPTETTLIATGQTEAFVARYDGDGTLRWAKRVGGDATCSGHDIAAYADGSCVAVVRIDGTVTFGAGEANETQLTSAGSADVAVARYEPDGRLAWARSAGSQAVDAPWGVAAFADGACVVTGSITGSVTFGAGEPNETELVAAGEWDIFVARYDAGGSLDWATSAGGALQDVAHDVAGFPNGSFVITGRMRGLATFGPGEFRETVLVSNGESDMFVARYGPDGLLDWAENVGGIASDQGEGVCACPDDSLLVTGRFQETATFHAGDAGETTLVSVGGQDVFVAHYEADGN
jgi:hypothetical protein